MKLNQLAAKPQLIKLTIDDEEIVAKYGEAIDFWTWDRQPMSVFMRLATLSQDNTAEIVNVVKTLILDEDGKEIIVGDMVLPTSILLKAVSAITTLLGK